MTKLKKGSRAAKLYMAKIRKKRKVFKVKRRSISKVKIMARRRTRRAAPRRRAARSRNMLGGLSVGKVGNLLKAVGLSFAIGAGTVQAINYAGGMANIPQAQQFAPVAGAFAAYTSNPGLAGIVAAMPLLQQMGIGLGTNTTRQGVGAFV